MLSEHFGCWARHAPLTLFDCVTCTVTCAIYLRSLCATSQRHDLWQWCNGKAIERRWRGAIQQLAGFVWESYFRATRVPTPAPVIVRATFSWPIYLLFYVLFLWKLSKNVATDFFIPFQRLVAMKQSQVTLKNTSFCTFGNISQG